MKREYSVATEPLHTGVTLIEASAGTGKTFTISGLFVRMVVEEGVPVREILVTTFTEAATAELRKRIRERLVLALDAVNGAKVTDALILQLQNAGRLDGENARSRLEIALRAFDEAAIHTIHSFCERMLRERALESGALFDAELLTDQSALFRELAEDYWRMRTSAASPVLVAACLERKVNPATLARLLREQSAHPKLNVLPAPPERAGLDAKLESLHADFCRQWSEWKSSVCAHFSATAKWAKGICAKPAEMSALLDLVSMCGTDTIPSLDAFGALATFSSESLRKNTKANGVTPEHAFFALCSQIADARSAFASAVEADFLEWARAELPRRLSARNLVSFDGLLTRLRDALAGPSGPALVDTVRKQFRAALVDEFQDTDPTQATIFSRLFETHDRWLFLIGDPKQAIYGFRGADVHAYLAVTAQATHQFRLGTNQRSASALVAAVNAIFSRAPHRFLIPSIDFDPVAAAGRADARPLLVDGEKRAPFRFWMTDAEEPLGSTRMNEELPAHVAAEIARLLDGRVTIDGQPLRPQGCAVLTFSNRQARAVRDALGKAGIPSVLFSDGSVFESEQADVLRVVLWAVVDPSRHGLLRAALATELFALTAAEIDVLNTDEHAWENWLLRFQGWNELWRAHGFMRMFRTLLRDCEGRSRILDRENGDRALTNFLHLAEVLHQTACEQRLAPAALVHWLATRQQENAAPAEEHELRLERDDDAVKIVTIHRSKGLEYDVVFCPFSWSGADLRKGERPRFHHPQRGLTLDLALPAQSDSARATQLERLEEHTRLLYVALTRARHECHFLWGRFGKIDISAANWLLHPPPNGDDPLAALAAHAATLTPQTVREEIEEFAAANPTSIAVDPLPNSEFVKAHLADATGPLGGSRSFTGHIDRTWRVSSFTSLTEHHDQELPDYDRAPAIAESVEPALPPSGIHAFPSGKTAGICLHAIFEHLDFTDASAVRELVAAQLHKHDFSTSDWLEPASECVQRTLDVELAPSLKLRDVPLRARLTELEFYFPVAGLAPEDLTALLHDADVERLSFEPRRGLLKGFIDLIFEHGQRFYIADWKSNRLGSDLSAYQLPALRSAMRDHRYGLQYHLYTLALHRYLRLRLGAAYDYEQHFGGVFYVFLRGVDPAQPELGIFRDRPTRERIEELDSFFGTLR